MAAASVAGSCDWKHKFKAVATAGVCGEFNRATAALGVAAGEAEPQAHARVLAGVAHVELLEGLEQNLKIHRLFK